MEKVIFYFDGFNFYNGLKQIGWKKYYWLDMVEFCSKLLKPNQELLEVNYFSARPINRGKQDRQDLFFSANNQNPKFNLYLGKYLPKAIVCKSCGVTNNTFEEKQTDVHIAVKMIRDIILEKCDVTILISADSDIVPPIDLIREIKPVQKIIVGFPPDRFSYDLKNKANAAIYLKNFESKFKSSMLPESIILPNGHTINRPPKWN